MLHKMKLWKRITSILLVFVLVLTMTPMTASAAEEDAGTDIIDASAMTDDELQAAVTEWLNAGRTAIAVNLAEDADKTMFSAITAALAADDIADGTIDLTISGAKTVPEYGFFEFNAYTANGEKNIAGDKLKSLTLTDVETIGKYAFSACTYLESVNLPQVVTIGNSAFSEWGKGTKLTSLDLPNATTIGNSAFANSSLLISVNLPKLVTIGESAFYGCDLRILDLPEVTTIDSNAFGNNDNLVSCFAPKATTVGAYPWGDCSKLETLELTAAGDFTLYNNLFAKTTTSQINLVLHKDKESQVTQNDDGTAIWKTTNRYGEKLEYTFKSITAEHTPETDDGDCTTRQTCTACGETVVEAKASHTFNENGQCADCEVQAVAKIDDIYYLTFSEALAAWEADTTLTLLADAVIAEDVALELRHLDKSGMVLDLNGKTLRADAEIIVAVGCSLTVRDSAGGGAYTGKLSIIVSGSLTLESGTIQWIEYNGIGTIDLSRCEPDGCVIQFETMLEYIYEIVTLPEGYVLLDENGKYVDSVDDSLLTTVTAHTHDLGEPISSADGKHHVSTCNNCGYEMANAHAANTTISCKGTYCTECKSYYGDETDPNTHRYEDGVCVCGAENIAPTGTITMKENTWDKFFNTITFGVFFKDYVDVIVTADGTGSDVAKVEYVFSATVLNESDWNSVAWEEIVKSNDEYKFKVEPQNKGAVYVRITDAYGNATVINSNGIVVYTDSLADTTSVTTTYDSNRDLSVKVILNGNTIKDVKFGTQSWIENGYCTVNGDTITLNGDKLAILDAGTYEFTVSYNPLGENYVDTEGNDAPATTTFKVVIEKAEGEVTSISDISKTYDATAVTAPSVDRLGDGAITIEYKVFGADDSTYTTVAPVNAGDYIMRVTVAEGTNHKQASATAEFSIEPADIKDAVVTLEQNVFVYDGTAHKPNVTVVFDGKTLQEGVDYKVSYRLPMRWEQEKPVKWFGDDEISEDCINVNDSYFAVVEGMGNYYTENNLTLYVGFEIIKANPEYTIPTGLTATYGDTLADVTLPDGFSWQDAESTSVGNAGTNTFKATYTASDNDNYNNVTDIVVTIEVAKAIPTVTAPIAKELTYTGEAQSLVTAGSTTNGTLVYSTNENGTYTENIPTGVNAGAYSVWYKVIGDNNYTDVAPECITVVMDDETLPTVEIQMKDSVWKEFLNAITFGVFFKDTVDVTVIADGTGSDVAKVEYMLSGTALDNDSLPTADWTEVVENNGYKFSIQPQYKGSVYVRITDAYGNATVINSNGIVVYTDSVADTTSVTTTYGSNSDLSVKVILNGNTIKDVKLGTQSWIENGYCTVNGDTITLNGDKLSMLDAGTYEVTVSYNPFGETYVEAEGNDAPATTTFQVVIEKATITDVTAPTVMDGLSYNGKPQALISAGLTECGEMLYSLDDITYSKDVPKGTDAGEYIVYYKVVGDANHEDTGCESLIINIGKKQVEVSASIPDRVYGDDYQVDCSKVVVNFEGIIDGDEVGYVVKEAYYHNHSVTDNARVQVVYNLTGADVHNYSFPEYGDWIAPNYPVEAVGRVLPRDIADVQITLGDTLFYNGKEQTQEIIAKFNDKDVTYDISGNKQTNAGEYTLTVTGTGNYNGTVTINWKIENNWTPTEYTVSGEGWMNSDFVITAKDGYLVSLTNTADGVWSDTLSYSEETEDGSVTFYVKNTETGEISLAKTVTYKLDKTAPVISGIENGKTYYTTQTVDVTDKNLDTVTLNGTPVTGTITLDGNLDAVYTIVATDRAGNSTTVTVTMKPIEDVASNVEDVTSENVTLEDKTDLEAAKAELEEVLEENEGKYTEEEKEAIEAEIKRMEDALTVIENVTEAEAVIIELPETTDPDDAEKLAQIEQAQNIYNGLSEYEKSLLDEDVKEKLDKLAADMVAYDIISGDGSEWKEVEGGTVTLVANGLFDKFTGIEVDGALVDEEYYEAKSGSTIITLKHSYLETLSDGEHSITIVYVDGDTSGTFNTLAHNETEDIPQDDPQDDPQDKPQDKPTTPETGDNNSLWLWFALLFVGGGLTLTSIMGDKKQKTK